MAVNSIEKYAKQYLEREIRAIENSPRFSEFPELTVYEKALIYKYSEDGYERVNEILRASNGQQTNEFGRLLSITLDKLLDYKGFVYRSVNLTSLELNKYVSAFESNEVVKEGAFISTSKSRLTALQYNGNTFFRIYSRSGKDIEKIAKFGYHNPPNEKEVLFKSGISFKIVDISQENNYISVTIEEV